MENGIIDIEKGNLVPGITRRISVAADYAQIRKSRLGDNAIAFSPRRSYKSQLRHKHHHSIELMMELDADAMQNIRKYFQRHKWSVDKLSFVKLVMSNLPPSIQKSRTNIEMVSSLLDIFDDIDVNGDRNMSWEELTAYLVEVGTLKDDNEKLVSSPFNVSRDEDVSVKHETSQIHYVKYIKGMDRIVTFEEKSSLVKIYNTHLKFTAEAQGHSKRLLSSTYIEKLNFLVTSATDKTISFWNCDSTTKSLELAMRWSCQESQLSLQYYGNTLYSSDSCGNILAWNVELQEIKRVFKGHADVCMHLLPLQRLGLLASASLDHDIRLWEVTRGKERAVCKGHSKGVTQLAYDNHSMLASGGLDKYVLLWRLDSVLDGKLGPMANEDAIREMEEMERLRLKALKEKGENPSAKNGADESAENVTIIMPRIQLRLGFGTMCVGVEFTPARAQDTSKLVIGSDKGAFRVFECDEFTLVSEFSLPPGCIPRIFDMTLTPPTTIRSKSSSQQSEAGALVVCGSKLIKFDRSPAISIEQTDEFPLSWAQFNEVSLTFITIAGSGIKVWCALTGQLEREHNNVMDNLITASCMDTRKRRLVLGDEKGKIKVFNYNSMAFMEELESHTNEVSCLQFFEAMIKDGCPIVSGSWDHTICAHADQVAQDEGSIVKNVRSHTADVVDMAVHTRYKVAASASVDGSVLLYEWAFSRCLGQFKVEGSVTCIEFVSQYPMLLAADSEGWISLFYIKPGTANYLMCKFDSNVKAVVGESASTSGLLAPPIDSHDEDEGHNKPFATCMKVYAENGETFLFTGNSQGIIKRWPLTEILNKQLSYEQEQDSRKWTDVTHRSSKETFRDARRFAKLERTKKKLREEATKRHSELSHLRLKPESELERKARRTKESFNARQYKKAHNALMRTLVLKKMDGHNAEVQKRLELKEAATKARKKKKSAYLKFERSVFVPDLQFAAHADGIRGISMIEEKFTDSNEPVLLTWSGDCVCRLWSARSGKALCRLLQEHNNSFPKRNANHPWNFHFKLEVHKDIEKMQLDALVASDPSLLSKNYFSASTHQRNPNFHVVTEEFFRADVDELIALEDTSPIPPEEVIIGLNDANHGQQILARETKAARNKLRTKFKGSKLMKSRSPFHLHSKSPSTLPGIEKAITRNKSRHKKGSASSMGQQNQLFEMYAALNKKTADKKRKDLEEMLKSARHVEDEAKDETSTPVSKPAFNRMERMQTPPDIPSERRPVTIANKIQKKPTKSLAHFRFSGLKMVGLTDSQVIASEKLDESLAKLNDDHKFPEALPRDFLSPSYNFGKKQLRDSFPSPSLELLLPVQDRSYLDGSRPESGRHSVAKEVDSEIQIRNERPHLDRRISPLGKEAVLRPLRGISLQRSLSQIAMSNATDSTTSRETPRSLARR